MKAIFFLLFSLTLPNAFAYENEWALKMGTAYVQSIVSQVEVAHTLPVGFGLSSHIGKRYKDWEFNASSYLNITRLKAMRVEANGSEIQGDGNFQSVTFGPTFRYYQHDWAIKRGTPYFVGGIHTVVQSMKFGVNSVTVTQGNFNNNHKLTWEGYGALAGIGLDRNKKEKENYYMEFVTTFNSSRKTSEVAGNTQVELVTKERKKRTFETSFFFTVGMTLF